MVEEEEGEGQGGPREPVEPGGSPGSEQLGEGRLSPALGWRASASLGKQLVWLLLVVSAGLGQPALHSTGRPGLSQVQATASPGLHFIWED